MRNVFLLGCAVGAAAGCTGKPMVDNFDDVASPILAITVGQLAAAYQEDSPGADERFAGRRLMVTAKVDSIRPGSYVNLKGANGMPAQLQLAPGHESETAMLEVGEVRSFECLEVSELLNSPMLERCRLTPARR